MSADPVPLSTLAALVRSKNAGPFWLTIDVMFRDDDGYRRACECPALAPAALAALLRVDPRHLVTARVAGVRTMKFSFPRRHSAGSPRDSDTLGGQQYAALLGIVVG